MGVFGGCWLAEVGWLAVFAGVGAGEAWKGWGSGKSAWEVWGSAGMRGKLNFLVFHFIVPLLCKFFVYLQSLFFVRELLLHF